MRPPIELQICRVPTSVWVIFRHHHYLDTNLHKAAICFGAWWNESLIAFCAWLPHVGQKNAKRVTRTVCLPDYQGVGIGNALMAHTASMYSGLGVKCRVSATHPGLIASCNRSPLWALTRQPARSGGRSVGKFRCMDAAKSYQRLIASFQYVGPPMIREDAERLLHSHVEGS
jgi:GNAT superfamily N-acetyltransferase